MRVWRWRVRKPTQLTNHMQLPQAPPRLYRLQHEPHRVGHLVESLGGARQVEGGAVGVLVAVCMHGMNVGEAAGEWVSTWLGWVSGPDEAK